MNNLGWLKLLILFVIVFAMQMTVAEWLSFFDVAPDFVIIFIVAMAIRRGPTAGCFWGFVAGFTQDVYAPVEWLGANSIAMTIVGFAVGQLEERFLTLNLPAKIGVLGLAFFVNDMFYFLITGLEKDVVTNLFVTKTVPGSIYTMVLGGILFYLSSGKKSDV